MKPTPRFNGKPEIWFSAERNSVIVRDKKHFCNELKLANDSAHWNLVIFKEPFTFDEFYNGSKYLQENGFELVGRIE